MEKFIRQLKNPFTNNYLEFREVVLGGDFPWYWQETVTEPAPTGLRKIKGTVDDYLDQYSNPPFYSHCVINRPAPGPGNKLFPYGISPYLHLVGDIVKEIFEYNEIDVDCIFRVNLNAVDAAPNEQQITFPHVDHPFQHSNMFVYLNDAGGKTIIHDYTSGDLKEVSHEPKIDDIITFPGLLHCHKLPEKGRRIVLVVTYQESDPRVTGKIEIDGDSAEGWGGGLMKEYEGMFDE